MKQIRVTIAMLAAALTLTAAGNAVAQTPAQGAPVQIVKSAIKKIRLQTPAGATMDVSVIDQTGTVLYSGAVRAKDNRGTSLNLANLPDGRYYVTATNNDFWMSQGILVRNDQVTVDAQNVTEVVRPALVAYAKNKYEVVMPGVKTLNVAIYDRMNELVFTKSFGSSGEVHRFDLSSLPTGEYTFVYGPEQKQFTEHVAIK
ncbi:T9SS C-terminal target domain-containing protein [uncultured Fibrella sp.]|uniref:T9SS C-terminal target domain-containing protein n=1 Tax=uncultured Fibrella sp. TaxID=1284596 RepID=UPI0035CAAB46